MADLYWLRTIQYLGEQIQQRRPAPHLYPLVEFVTRLDPQFFDAFRLGALFLAIGGQYPEAIAVYERGIARHPDRWELPHDLGRLYFLELKDDARALEWWLAADRLPGRPHYLPRFIARLYAKVGATETALELWQRMAAASDNEWVQERAKAEIKKLLAEMQRQGRAASRGAR
jgi:tetratricopeptide (TPR) repeat protein